MAHNAKLTFPIIGDNPTIVKIYFAGIVRTDRSTPDEETEPLCLRLRSVRTDSFYATGRLSVMRST